ncbi:hypothetical protein LSH36_468g03022 [Paralvinella palmiformis]|uniref:G-protein coupled receptors family 1 profile domain-containing protein n=1 Tax=Paralvinella palmiformis TaxID=53620 RepID=A0AAD9JAQ0_9ANNE|nr:hypothetical protein LSH36_468g03022 [Paralvinella palmiformis]
MDLIEGDARAITDNATNKDVTTLGFLSGIGNVTEVASAKSEADDNFRVMRFICEVIVSFPIAVMGILANGLVFVVLCRQKKRLTTNVLLQALAIADTLILISSILLRSMRYVGWQSYNDVYHYIFVSLYPCVYFFRLADTWITVVMTIDRYIAVCYPLQAQRLCTLRRTYVIIGVILLATFAFSMPRFFEFELGDDNDFQLTKLVKSRSYTLAYRITIFFLVMYLVPMALLTVLNIRLLHTLRRAYRKRDTMVSGGSMRSRNREGSHMTSSGRSVTLIVVSIVIVCVLCNVITMLSHVFWALHVCFAELRHLESKRRFLANVSNIMVTFNSAINFVIYCMFSRQFRIYLRHTMRSKCTEQGRARDRWRSQSHRKSSESNNVPYFATPLHERLSYKSRSVSDQ